MATQRLIDYLATSTGSYECFTSMLWVNVLGEIFPLNDNDSWFYSPEFAHDRGRCDLVLMQSNANWPPKFKAYGLPFIAAEFKSSSAKVGDDEWEKGYDQMLNTVFYFLERWYKGQQVYGIIAAGTRCAIYVWEDPPDSDGILQRVHQAETLDLASADDRQEILDAFRAMKATSPVVTAQW